MNVMRVTAGPWTLAERSTSYIMGGDGRAVCSVWADGGLLRQKGDAALIAEAGTVYNETGRTPRQLADDVAKLRVALRDCVTLLLFLPSEYVRVGSGLPLEYSPDGALSTARAALAATEARHA